MSIRPLVLTAMLLSPIATMADGYHHQRRYSTQRTCYKEIYREEYIAGERSSKGYVKSYLDKDLLSSRFFCAFLNPEDRRICREVVNRFLGTDASK